MAKEFKIGNQHLIIDGEVDKYNEIWKRLLESTNQEVRNFIGYYDACEDIDNFLKSGYQTGLSCIDNVFCSFADIFISQGCFDFSVSYLHNNAKYKGIIEEYVLAFNDVLEKVKSLDQYEEIETRKREVRKHSRFQVQGGGFGVTGAAKGIIIAETFNLATGLIHSAFNLLGDLYTGMEVAGDKRDVYVKSKGYLTTSLQKSMVDIIEVLIETMNLGISFNKTKAEVIMSNIKSGIIKDDIMRVALNEAIKAYPYNDEIYTFYCVKYNEVEDDVCETAKFFGFDMTEFIKNIHYVNGFYFNDIFVAHQAKVEHKEIQECLEKTYNKKLADEFLEDRYWSTVQDKVLIDFVINTLSEFANNSEDELRNYYEYIIGNFNEKKSRLNESGNCNFEYSDETIREYINAVIEKYQSLNSHSGVYLKGRINQSYIEKAFNSFAEDAKGSDVYLYLVGDEYWHDALVSSKGIFIGKAGNADGYEKAYWEDIENINYSSDFDETFFVYDNNGEILLAFQSSDLGNCMSGITSFLIGILNVFKENKIIKSSVGNRLEANSNDETEVRNTLIYEDENDFDWMNFVINKYKYLGQSVRGLRFADEISEADFKRAVFDYAYGARYSKPIFMIDPYYNGYLNHGMLLTIKGLYIGRYKEKDSKLVVDNGAFYSLKTLMDGDFRFDDGMVFSTIMLGDKDIFYCAHIEKYLGEIVKLIKELLPVAYFENEKQQSRFNDIDCTILGDCYRDGAGVNKNIKKAFVTYLKGYYLFDSAWCCNQIGGLYKNGHFGVRLSEKAKYWYLKAYEKGLYKYPSDTQFMQMVQKNLAAVENVNPVSDIQAFIGDEFNDINVQNVIKGTKCYIEGREKYHLTSSNFEYVKNNILPKYTRSDKATWQVYPGISEETQNEYAGTYQFGRKVLENDLLLVYLNPDYTESFYVFKWGIISYSGIKFEFKQLEKILIEDNGIYVIINGVKECLRLFVNDEERVQETFEIITSLFSGEVSYEEISEEPEVKDVKINAEYISLPYENIVTYVEQYKGAFSSNLFCLNDIPPKKLKNVIGSYASNLSDNSILMLYDDTIFGSAKDGFVVHYYGLLNSKGVCINFSDIAYFKLSERTINVVKKTGEVVKFWNVSQSEAYWLTILIGVLLNAEFVYGYKNMYPKCKSVVFDIKNR